MDSVPSHHEPSQPIAVIGMACRLPGSIDSTSSFREALLSKRNTYTPVPPSRFTHASFHHPDGSRPGSLNIPGGNFINSSLAEFDAGFFGVSPVDAYVMDPQQRILLEVAYECLESAGVPAESLKGQNVGVYVGAWTSDYENIQVKDPSAKEAEASWITGTGRAILSNRVSYVFDFKGPSMTIDTGCSASAMALHTACQALRAPSSNTHSALVGGTNLMINPEMPISMTKLGILSPTGSCKTFDERADGYSRADGINCLYLKRLSDALRDGDPIRAVIRSSAINSDGKTLGLTAPSSSSQEAAIREAYAFAKISDFTETAYFECHGTATKVGDPIEAAAIGNVFGRARHTEDPLYVGAVKTIIGHSEASSALSAVIKTVLAVESGTILPNVGFEKPNPKIKFEAWKLKVPTEVLPWPRNKAVKRASVGAFGYGGANAHFIIDDIESYLSNSGISPTQRQSALDRKGFLHPREATENSMEPNRSYLLIFSAKTPSAVRGYVNALATFFDGDSVRGKRSNFADLAYTLGIRRSILPTKAIAIVPATKGALPATNGDIAEQLKLLSENLECFPEATGERRIGFVFTGQGAQWAGMGVELISAFPLVARTLNELNGHLRGLKYAPDWDIIEELKKPKETSRINEPQFAQVLCTAIQICLVKLLRSWGVYPQAVVGHSSGEISAAFASGSLTSTQAITIAYYRGMICSLAIQNPDFPKGGMLAVGLSETAVGEFLEPFEGRIGVACVNSPKNVTISGDADALKLLEEKLSSSRSTPGGEPVFFRRLQVPLAYHSHHMGFLGSVYQALIGAVTPKVGCYPMYSSVTGELLDGRKLGAGYWQQNLESTVLFSDAVTSMVVGGASVNTLLEIGPHSALASSLRDIRAEIGIPAEALIYCPTLIRRKNASHAILEVAGKLFTHGCPTLDLEKVNGIEEKFDETTGNVIYQSRRVLVDLPNYVWDHSQEYWLECRRSREWRFQKHLRHDILGTRVPGIDPSEPQWMNVLSINNTPWIQDHVVRGNVVFPATGYICMAVEALTQYLESNDQFNPDPENSFSLRDITIQKPLVLGDESSRSRESESPIKGTEVFLTLRREPTNTTDASRWYHFNIHTTSRSGKENVRHCSGVITMEKRNESHRLPGTGGQPLREIPSRQFYEALNAVGFNYGPTFAGLGNLRARTDKPEMWAEMSNYIEGKNISSGAQEQVAEEKSVVVENGVSQEDGVAQEDSEDEAVPIQTPATSSGSASPRPSHQNSTLPDSSAIPVSSGSPTSDTKTGQDTLLGPPQANPTPPEFEGLASTESAAVATLRRLRMGSSAKDHIESRTVIHPINLDLTLQLLFGTLHSGRMSAITDIMVPVFIEEMYIAFPSPDTKSFAMHAMVGDMGDMYSTAYDACGQEVIRVKNLEARELGHVVTGRGGKGDSNIMRLNWVVDYDALSQENYRKAMDTVAKVAASSHRTEDDLQLNYLVGLMTAEVLDMTEGLTPAKPYFEKYRSWLIDLHQWNTEQKRRNLGHDPQVNGGPLTSVARKAEIERLVPKCGVRGELVHCIYSNTLGLFRGEIDFDELLQTDELWDRFNDAEDITQCVTSLSSLYSAKYCKANILEIGAGTGCGTHAILEGCTSNAGTPAMERRYQSYTFTDRESEVVAEGKEKFGLGYKGMDFRTLNIEKDPGPQGFQRNYDIVYAINVLHETKNMRESARNIAKLLPLGGKVHIVDFISPDAEADMEYVPFAFGISESWWRAEEEYRSKTPLILVSDWIKVLELTGFRVDFTVSDAQLSTVYACLVGTYIGPQPSIAPTLEFPQISTDGFIVPTTGVPQTSTDAPTLEASQISTEGSTVPALEAPQTLTEGSITPIFEAPQISTESSIVPTLEAPQLTEGSITPILESLQPPTEGSIVLLYRSTLTPDIEHLRQSLITAIKTHEVIPISFDTPAFEVPEGARFVLSLLEIEEALLADINHSDFKKLKHLMSIAVPVLWITSGVHLDPQNPKGALITGFARTLRNEVVNSEFNLLDLSSKSQTEAATQISSLVKLILGRQTEASAEATRKTIHDWEFCEFQGLRYVPRVTMDSATVAKYNAGKDHMRELEAYAHNEKNLGLVCAQRGILSSLVFQDKGVAKLDLPDEHVEISPDVFGLNSEDVTNALEIGSFGTLGIACSGIIRRIGSKVEDFQVGDRIFTLSPNEFRNRFSIPVASCNTIPADTNPIDFTGSLVLYMTVVRGILDIARMEKGEKILIHKAAGGVGLAAIQLCKHIGAEIFVTCGSVEEVSFLTETQHIPADHIFSSSDTSFREAIMAATGGEGVDVILNSLAGELLHESWKCLASCGRFIDLGKRDILLAGKLSMTGFRRNNIYAAVDLTGMLAGGNKLLTRLLKDVIQLFSDEAIKPISPITQLPITEVEEAFKRMTTSSFIGSIVLTVEQDPSTQQTVNVVQSPREVQFDPEGTYLLIGGLGGVGCSLAVWMAEKGAKHLTFMARSGAQTEEAKSALEDIASLGCETDVLRCDVADFEAVEAAMATITRPLRGIMHAAMVLKDAIFENMEHSDFVLPLRPKVNGLLNLEKVLDQHEYPKLDFFIVLSSIAGVLGTPGQTNYAAAGAFEDAFVRSRQLKGEQACALDLGVITNVGYVSQNPELERRLLNQPGIGSYNERQVQWLFRIALDTPLINPTSISSDQPQEYGKAQLVSGVEIQLKDISRVRETNWFQDPKWWMIDSIVSGASDGMGEGAFGDENALNSRMLDLLNNVNKQPERDVIDNLAQCIIWKTAVMTMMPAEDILPDRPLSRYGMDSLAAVEMRNWFLRVGEVELKVEDILAAVSITKLAEKVYSGYKQKGGGKAPKKVSEGTGS